MVTENSVLVIGAGISGSSTAYHLNKQGWDVTVVDQEKENSLPIYNNPAVCINPNIMINDKRFNRLMCSSISYVWQLIEEIKLGESSAQQVGSIYILEKNEGMDRFNRLIINNPDLKNYISVISQKKIWGRYKIEGSVGLYFSSGGWIDPKDLCKRLLINKNIHKEFNTKVTAVEYMENMWSVSTSNNNKFKAKNIVFCSAADIKNYHYFSHLDFDQYRGQINWVDSEQIQFAEILSNDGYVIPVFKNRSIVGSSYDKNNSSHADSEVDTKNNLKKLTALLPTLNYNSLGVHSGSWVGQRAASFDRRPFVGRILDHEHNKHLDKKNSVASLMWQKGLYINACYGSRGFSFAPLASLSLANMMCCSLGNTDKFILDYLNPERRYFRSKGLKKHGIKF